MLALHCILLIEYVLNLKFFKNRGLSEYSGSDIHPDLQTVASALIVDRFWMRIQSVDYFQASKTY